MKCCGDNESAKATNAAQYANDEAPLSHIGPRTVNTGSSLMLAEKPLPTRNASYTYETCGALGQVCKGNPQNAEEN